jgi:plasmid stabilization system protein ParE
MSRRLIVRPEAEADITEAAVWYESRESGLGLEITSEIQTAIGRALKDPEIFPRLRKNPHVRRVLARRFPYRVFYIVRPDALVVFAVLHAVRHDRIWKHRLQPE